MQETPAFAAMLADLFPARLRFSGATVPLNICFALLSGLGVLAAASLTRATGWDATLGLSLAGCGALSFAASQLLPQASLSVR